MKKKLSFKMIYIVYVSVLVLLVALATLYVSRLLKKYEDTMPEQSKPMAPWEFFSPLPPAL